MSTVQCAGEVYRGWDGSPPGAGVLACTQAWDKMLLGSQFHLTFLVIW